MDLPLEAKRKEKARSYTLYRKNPARVFSHPAKKENMAERLKKRSLSLVYVTIYFLLGVLIRILRAKSDS